MSRQADRTALVTGAGSGIGRAIAERLASAESSFVTGTQLVVDGGATAA